jgi:hypothetical protein
MLLIIGTETAFTAVRTGARTRLSGGHIAFVLVDSIIASELVYGIQLEVPVEALLSGNTLELAQRCFYVSHIALIAVEDIYRQTQETGCDVIRVCIIREDSTVLDNEVANEIQ